MNLTAISDALEAQIRTTFPDAEVTRSFGVSQLESEQPVVLTVRPVHGPIHIDPKTPPEEQQRTVAYRISAVMEGMTTPTQHAQNGEYHRSTPESIEALYSFFEGKKPIGDDVLPKVRERLLAARQETARIFVRFEVNRAHITFHTAKPPRVT